MQSISFAKTFKPPDLETQDHPALVDCQVQRQSPHRFLIGSAGDLASWR
jgi:hypothetical protein